MRDVVCCLIHRDDALLVTQRRPDQQFPLKWQLPGGKIEAGETPKLAAERELMEELAIAAYVNGLPLEVIEWEGYRLFYMHCPMFSRTPQNLAGADMRWANAVELEALDFLEHDREVARRFLKAWV